MRISTQNIACSQRQMYTVIHYTQLYITSIQPANKAAEHLINSIPVLRGGEAVKVYLINNSNGGGGEHYHKQSEGLG